MWRDPSNLRPLSLQSLTTQPLPLPRMLYSYWAKDFLRIIIINSILGCLKAQQNLGFPFNVVRYHSNMHIPLINPIMKIQSNTNVLKGRMRKVSLCTLIFGVGVLSLGVQFRRSEPVDWCYSSLRNLHFLCSVFTSYM